MIIKFKCIYVCAVGNDAVTIRMFRMSKLVFFIRRYDYEEYMFTWFISEYICMDLNEFNNQYWETHKFSQKIHIYATSFLKSVKFVHLPLIVKGVLFILNGSHIHILGQMVVSLLKGWRWFWRFPFYNKSHHIRWICPNWKFGQQNVVRECGFPRQWSWWLQYHPSIITYIHINSFQVRHLMITRRICDKIEEKKQHDVSMWWF